jgi:hypothetical protein
LAEHWNGTTWKVLATPNPAGTQNAVLEGVACLSATNCWADGDNQYDAVEKSFIQHWNGTKWSMAAASFPAKSFLAGISCASATSCAVVGGQRSGSGYRPLAERWNGSTWTTVTTPDANGFVDVFDGVSCVNGSNCHAAGYDILDTPAQPISTLTMRWNGTKWSLT